MASNTTVKTIAPIKTTTTVRGTNAPILRVRANRDLPEYGMTKDQVVYLVRSSADTGEYYIVRWSYEAVEWQCPCKSFKPCKHLKAVNAACVTRKGVMQKLELLAKALEERATFEKIWGHSWSSEERATFEKQWSDSWANKKAAPARGTLNRSNQGFNVLLNNTPASSSRQRQSA